MMDSLELSGDIGQSELLNLEQHLRDDSPENLSIGNIAVTDPLTRASLLQLITTWSRQNGARSLEILDVVGEDQLHEQLSGDSISFLAALFADRLADSVGADLTRRFSVDQTELRIKHCAVYPWERFDHEAGVRTAIMSFTRTTDTGSPDFGSRKFEGWSTDFASRTLYTPIDLESVLQDERESVESLSLQSDHQVVASKILRNRLFRVHWPTGHPLSTLGVEFSALGRRIFPASEKSISRWVAGHSVDSTPGDWLGHALYELVQNAERHAVRAVDGAGLVNPATVVLAERLIAGGIDRERVASSLSEYLFGEEDSGVTNYLAVTVLDCGDGMASTASWRAQRRKPGNAAEEASFLRTAVSGQLRERSGPLHGFGLPLVQHLVSDLGGYIRVRSGQSVLYRNYRKYPYSLGSPNPTAWEFDVADETAGFARLGTAVSIIIPRMDEE